MKRCISFSLFLVLFALSVIPISAASTNTTYYQEEMYQINFSDIDIQVSDAGELVFCAKEDSSITRAVAADNGVAQLLEAIEEFPSMESHMATMLEETGCSLCAISITEVPLLWIDDHYERIPANISKTADSSNPNGKGKFAMYTMIGVNDSTDPGKYVAWTCGSWSDSSIWGGEDYPAGGDDYVLQSTPNTFSRYDDALSVVYNNEPTSGEDGDEFWRENGDSSYVRYALEDSPSIFRRCTSFVLSTASYAPLSDGEYRQINSYYVHTWKQMSLSVSISANSDKTVGLELTPGISDKSWQVYNYITFNF